MAHPALFVRAGCVVMGQINGNSLTGVLKHPLTVAIIVGVFAYAGTQGAFKEKLTQVEKDAEQNAENISDLVHAIHANSTETAVLTKEIEGLSDRMRDIIKRMDSRAEERRRERENR